MNAELKSTEGKVANFLSTGIGLLMVVGIVALVVWVSGLVINTGEQYIPNLGSIVGFLILAGMGKIIIDDIKMRWKGMQGQIERLEKRVYEMSEALAKKRIL